MKLKNNNKIFAIFISYNSADRLETFYSNFPIGLFDRIILFDDVSCDNTYELALEENRGQHRLRYLRTQRSPQRFL